MDAESTSRAQPFWGRCGRALVMLLAAAAVHQWVLPRAISPGSRAGSAAPAVSAAGVLPAVPARRTPAPRVRVVTDVIPVPVGTSGVIDSPRSRDLRARATVPAVEVKAGRSPRESVAQQDTSAEEQRVEEPRRADEPRRVEEPRRAEEPPDDRETVLALAREAAPAPPPSPPPAPKREAVPTVNHEERVRHLLAQYVAAYEQLDVKAAKAVWPTLDEKALERAFAQLQAQQVTFTSCGITIDGRDAHALCTGEVTYRPRVGSRTHRLPERQWTFDLSQAANGWHIVDARIR